MKNTRIEFVEEKEWAERFEEKARAEGLSLSAWLRQLARRAVFSASLPTSEQCAHMSDKQAA